MSDFAQDIRIAPATPWRLLLSGLVLFLLQYALALVFSLILFAPMTFFLMLPVMAAIESGAAPPLGAIFGLMAVLFGAGVVFQVLATAFALAFVVGKSWGGARLVFVQDRKDRA